jgi:hypothetical protein
MHRHRDAVPIAPSPASGASTAATTGWMPAITAAAVPARSALRSSASAVAFGWIMPMVHDQQEQAARHARQAAGQRRADQHQPGARLADLRRRPAASGSSNRLSSRALTWLSAVRPTAFSPNSSENGRRQSVAVLQHEG